MKLSENLEDDALVDGLLAKARTKEWTKLVPLMSSAKTGGKDDWFTPVELFEKIERAAFPNGEKFELDPCADEANAKCKKFYTEKDDGLKQPWAPFKRVFINPPYSQIKEWMKKAVLEACLLRQDSESTNSAIVMLVPARTDTKWFQDCATKANTIVFLKGRVKFGGSKTGAPFPSAILVYTNKESEAPEVFFEDWRDQT